MLNTVSEFLENERTTIEKIYFVLFDEAGFKTFKAVLDKMDN